MWVKCSLIRGTRGTEIPPAIYSFAGHGHRLSPEQSAEFNRALAGYRHGWPRTCSTELRKGRAEFYFNNVKPFLHAMIIYLCAFVLASARC